MFIKRELVEMSKDAGFLNAKARILKVIHQKMMDTVTDKGPLYEAYCDLFDVVARMERKNDLKQDCLDAERIEREALVGPDGTWL